MKGLSFRSQLSATLSNSRQGLYWGAQCNANRPTYAGTPHAEVKHAEAYSYMWENILNYKITVAKDHDFGATFVTSWQKAQNESYVTGGSGQDMDKWFYHRLASAKSQHIESDYSQTQKMSYALRFNYSYKGRYLLNLSNRWDGVSWFSQGNKWDSFFAAALAWRISDEAFMQKASQFILTQQLLDKRYVNYERFIRKIDPKIVKDFLNETVSNFCIKDGLTTSILLKNGIELRFSYKTAE